MPAYRPTSRPASSWVTVRLPVPATSYEVTSSKTLSMTFDISASPSRPSATLSPGGEGSRHRTSSSSTSKTSVEFAGIFGFASMP